MKELKKDCDECYAKECTCDCAKCISVKERNSTLTEEEAVYLAFLNIDRSKSIEQLRENQAGAISMVEQMMYFLSQNMSRAEAFQNILFGWLTVAIKTKKHVPKFFEVFMRTSFPVVIEILNAPPTQEGMDLIRTKIGSLMKEQLEKEINAENKS